MTLKTGVVGLRMGKAHVNAIKSLPEYKLTALCDIDTSLAEELAAGDKDIKLFNDYNTMMETMNLDVIVIATPNHLHCPMTVKAANSGVKGIYCEKPVALNLEETNRMKEVCANNGVQIIIGHQRRMSTPYVSLKKLIDSGAVGDVYLIRGLCAGDCLSDGTHTIDSVLYLTGAKPVSIVSQIVCDYDDSNPSLKTRYGHPVETGSMSVIQLDNDVRFELFTGDMRIKDWEKPFPGWNYQDIEILGTKGRLWRCGDNSNPPVMIWTEKTEGWEAAPLCDDVGDIFQHVFRSFADTVNNGTPHPMSLENAQKVQEILMGVYESARLGKRLQFPVTQMQFPLQLMLDGEK